MRKQPVADLDVTTIFIAFVNPFILRMVMSLVFKFRVSNYILVRRRIETDPERDYLLMDFA